MNLMFFSQIWRILASIKSTLAYRSYYISSILLISLTSMASIVSLASTLKFSTRFPFSMVAYADEVVRLVNRLSMKITKRLRSLIQTLRDFVDSQSGRGMFFQSSMAIDLRFLLTAWVNWVGPSTPGSFALVPCLAAKSEDNLAVTAYSIVLIKNN
jgi:hypothetical protein